MIPLILYKQLSLNYMEPTKKKVFSLMIVKSDVKPTPDPFFSRHDMRGMCLKTTNRKTGRLRSAYLLGLETAGS